MIYLGELICPIFRHKVRTLHENHSVSWNVVMKTEIRNVTVVEWA
jgi:hypothetical protein